MGDGGNELPNVRGTLWAAYNGVAEHADYGLTSQSLPTYSNTFTLKKNSKGAWYIDRVVTSR